MMAMRVSRKLVAIRSNGSATYKIASTAMAAMARGATAIRPDATPSATATNTSEALKMSRGRR